MAITPENPDEGAQTRLANRETVRLPIQRRSTRDKPPGRRPARRAPLALAATVTTVWAAVVSLVPTLVAVQLVHAIDGTGAPMWQVARLGLAGWLLAHGVPLMTGIGPITLAPLALSAMAFWRVYRAGVHTARAIGARARPRTGGSWSPWPTLRAGGAVALVYGLLGILAAAVARHRGVEVSMPRAGLTLGGFGLVAGLTGAFVEARGFARLAARLPAAVRAGIRTGAVAALLVLGAGAAVAGLAIAIAGDDASQIIDDYHTGIAGQIGLVLVCGFYTPDIAVWTASYLVGPGFTIGAGTSISAAAVTLGPLPTVPLFAGLPSGPATGWAPLLLGLPLAAALVAGWLLGRRTLREAPERSWAGLLVGAALAGPVAGVLLALVSLAASGSLGGGRLAQVGPHAGAVAFVAMLMIAMGTVFAAAATKVALRARSPRSGPES